MKWKDKNNCLTRFAVLIGLAISLFATASAALAEPPSKPGIPGSLQPPAENPYPPRSAKDKRRVAFAEQVIESQLRNIVQLSDATIGVIPIFQNKDLACLKTLACYGKDFNYVQTLRRLQNTYGKVLEVRHVHIVPWSLQKFLQQRHRTAQDSPGMGGIAPAAVPGPMVVAAPQVKDDEYLIHAYARFSKTGNWNHLDVIVTEDASGRLAFRYFFTAPMGGLYAPPC